MTVPGDVLVTPAVYSGSMQSEPSSTTFIVRVTVTEDGVVNGIVERPKTGEKHRFHGAEALGGLIALLAKKAAEVAQP